MITPPPGNSADRVLQVVNEARAANGLPLYVVSTALDQAAADHDLLMATGCGLSHRCPHERSLGDRETARSVVWRTCGENAAAGGPVDDNEAAIGDMAARLAAGMLAERPPADGHRRNMLSRAFRTVGIAVTRSASGTVYLTEDFAG